METIALWWLSFCDPAKPKDTQFLGTVLVFGKPGNIASAICTAQAIDCNPGGEVCGIEFDPSMVEQMPESLISTFSNRMLSKPSKHPPKSRLAN